MSLSRYFLIFSHVQRRIFAHSIIHFIFNRSEIMKSIFRNPCVYFWMWIKYGFILFLALRVLMDISFVSTRFLPQENLLKNCDHYCCRWSIRNFVPGASFAICFDYMSWHHYINIYWQPVMLNIQVSDGSKLCFVRGRPSAQRCPTSV